MLDENSFWSLSAFHVVLQTSRCLKAQQERATSKAFPVQCAPSPMSEKQRFVCEYKPDPLWASLVAQEVKESAYNAGNLGVIPRLGRSPGGGHGNPLQHSGPENPHGQKSMDYSPWGRKKSDTTDRLSPAQHTDDTLRACGLTR